MRQLIFLLASILLFSCSDNNKKAQEPMEPLPYESREVNFKILEGDVTLSGTLTTPIIKNGSLKTAVVLISGSGPNDRDYKNQFGHTIFSQGDKYATCKTVDKDRHKRGTV